MYYQSFPMLINVIVVGNHADYEGVGGHMWNGGVVTIINSVFSSNYSGYEGGALSLDDTSTAILLATSSSLINAGDSTVMDPDGTWTGTDTTSGGCRGPTFLLALPVWIVTTGTRTSTLVQAVDLS